jgi:glucose/arabinose dehydrogenase
MCCRVRIFLLLFVFFLGACQGEDNAPPAPVEAPTEAATAVAGVTTTLAPPVAATDTPQGEGTEPALEEPVEATPVPEPTALPPGEPASAIALEPVVQGLESPTYLTHAGDERLFITEQGGRIQVVEGGQVASEPFLDITDRVGSNANEQGLLSVAFHPQYAENGFFYVNYTDNNGDTVISRFRVSDSDPNQADAASEMVLLNIPQPYGNHNGGLIKFGPDGYLYVGMGDGGSAGDPDNNGQNPGTLLGALLRLAVNAGDDEVPYAIPQDNPYLDNNQARGEVWAIGLRNPWRFSFDRQTGDLYVADVGQNQYEEVHFVPAGQGGGLNYGWPIMEGLHCFRQENCDQSGLQLPVVEYSHAQGGCSITGGYVYRGEQFAPLRGNYFFGDFCSGMIWSLFQTADGQWQWSEAPVATIDENITSFGEDVAGELYVVTRQGVIYRIRS